MYSPRQGLDNDHIISQLQGMQTGDTLAFFIRHHNAAIILTKWENCILCKAFELSPDKDNVEKTLEPLICSYPSALFYGILQSVGRAANVPHVTKPMALFASSLHDVGCDADVLYTTKCIHDHTGRWGKINSNSNGEVKVVWCRSPLWLLIKVAIHITVNRSLERAFYKQFILFFMCTLARDKNNTKLSSELLHLMSSRILRCLGKLGSSPSEWLSEMALETCTCPREILDARWKQLHARPSLFRNPSWDELSRDATLSLLGSREYIRNVLANPSPESVGTPFHPSHCHRGTIEDFLSLNGTFFEEAYHNDRHVTLYDVHQLVEQGIDNWIAYVMNVDEGCAQLEILMDKYLMEAHSRWYDRKDMSIELLTGVELYVALDKLVVKQIPMLADYPPEIPIAFLEGLLLVCKATSLHPQISH
ncbi:hypothetical protein OG21DRAFT_1527327 [Imleria badia]|nr:hypothetical protein OG21DRAFT_1527327 [Imleria badia]